MTITGINGLEVPVRVERINDDNLSETIASVKINSREYFVRIYSVYSKLPLIVYNNNVRQRKRV